MEYMKQKHPDEQKAIRKAVALKAAIDFSLGIWGLKGIEISPGEALSDKTIDKVKDVANKFEEWLGPNSNKSDTSDKGITGPTPTLEQKEVLDGICKQLGIQPDTAYPNVLRWAKEEYNVDHYPTKKSSIEAFVQWYRS